MEQPAGPRCVIGLLGGRMYALNPMIRLVRVLGELHSELSAALSDDSRKYASVHRE